MMRIRLLCLGQPYTALEKEFKMNKYYEEPILTILFIQDEIVTTSTGKDPFDDNYQDFGDGN